MAVRFIIGRAGSGKTFRCLHSIRSRLREDPIDGPRLILLVPEQAGLQMERAILQPQTERNSTEGIPAAHRAEVLSFQRLAFRVLEATGGAVRSALTEAARSMVLRHLIGRNADRLGYYRVTRGPSGERRLGGLVERLGATISELIQEAVGPAALDLPDGADAAADDPGQRAKFRDLKLLYEAYLGYLGDDKRDPSQYLQLARARLSQCAWLHGAHLWIDGFASFSGQETLTILALGRLCAHTEITMLLDPRLAEPASVDARTRAGLLAIFGKTLRSFLDLRERFVDAGVGVEPPRFLQEDPQPRFGRSLSLAQLERNLFTEAMEVGAADVAATGIDLVELPSRRVEVEYAVSRITRWTTAPEGGYRFRDLAIIVRDLEPYHELLAAGLRARNIPFFIDRRRPIAHHSLVELLRGGIALATDGVSQEALRLVLKTGLLPLRAAGADEMENYLLANNISGPGAWNRDEWGFDPRPRFGTRDREPTRYERETLVRVNAARSAVLPAIRPWLPATLAGAPRDGSAWAKHILSWWQDLDISGTLGRWCREAEADGDLEQADEHRQVWRELLELLDDLSFALAGVPLGVNELADVVESGLAGRSLGLVPPTVDQVLVGAIERSRHPEIKAAVILGFSDGVFPHHAVEDSILNDDDRDALQRRGVRVQAGASERVLDERLLVYVALTRAAERLVVTYPTTDEAGRSLRPSPCVADLRAAWPGLRATPVADAVRSRGCWDVLSPGDLTRRIVGEFRERPSLHGDNPVMRGRWNSLYHFGRPHFGRDPAAALSFRGLAESEPCQVSPEVVERLSAKPMQASVSQLESYAACPFQHFARNVLRLRERPVGVLEPVDEGKIHHEILENLVKTMAQRRIALADLSQEELLAALGKSCAEVAARLPKSGVVSTARNAYILRRSAAKLAMVLRAQHRFAAGGRLRSRACELPFGFDIPGGLPALELTTPKGRTVQLRGFIDRVDLAELGDELLGVVIDYKRRADQRLDLTKVFHGISLQLPAYLLVLAQGGRTLAGRPIRPAGALFVTIARRYRMVTHPESVPEAPEPCMEGEKLRGAVRSEAVDVLDASGFRGWSQHLNVFRRNDGSLGHVDQGDAYDSASFDAILAHTQTRLGELADRILDGDFAVAPYRLGDLSPCTWCSMRPVCRFEMGLHPTRFLDAYRRSEVLARFAPPSPATGDDARHI